MNTPTGVSHDKMVHATWLRGVVLRGTSGVVSLAMDRFDRSRIATGAGMSSCDVSLRLLFAELFSRRRRVSGSRWEVGEAALATPAAKLVPRIQAIPNSNGEILLCRTLVLVARGPRNSRFMAVSRGAPCREGRWMSKMAAQKIRGRLVSLEPSPLRPRIER